MLDTTSVPNIEFLFSDTVVKLLKTSPLNPNPKLKPVNIKTIDDKNDHLFSPELAELLKKNITDPKNRKLVESSILTDEDFTEILFSEIKKVNLKSKKSGIFYIKSKSKIHKILFSLWIEFITGIKVKNFLTEFSAFDLNVNYRFPISSLKSISTKNMVIALSLATRKICEGYIFLAKNIESQAIALVLKYAVPKVINFINIPKKEKTYRLVEDKFLGRIKPLSQQKTISTTSSKKEEKSIKILCDFDGTITKKDVSIAILDKFTSGTWRNLPRNVIKGNIGSKELYRIVEDKILGSLDDMRKFSSEFVEIEDGFTEFINFSSKFADIEIVSDGFSFYIEETEKKFGLNLNYHASELCEKSGKLEFKFPNQSKFCNLCATCKLEVYRRRKISDKNIKGEFFTIFAGNGISDRCIVEEADIVFAKSRLKEICQQKGLDFAPFENFYDIIETLSISPACFIIDFDGTLAWSYEGIKEAFEYALEKLGKPFPENIQKYIGLPLKKCFEIITGEEAEKGVKLFREKYKKIFLKKTYPAPGALETLKKLKRLGYKVAILSNKKTEFLKKLTENFGFHKYTDLIVGEGDVKDHKEDILKPNKKVIEFICDKLNITPQETFIVGDSEIDHQTAISSSAKFIALYSEIRSPNFFSERGKVYFFISSISGLEKIAYLYKLLYQ